MWARVVTRRGGHSLLCSSAHRCPRSAVACLYLAHATHCRLVHTGAARAHCAAVAMSASGGTSSDGASAAPVAMSAAPATSTGAGAGAGAGSAGAGSRDGVRFIDVGANLVDTMFQGEYRGSQKHEPDLDVVLERAWAAGLEKIVVTGTSLAESRQALEVCTSVAYGAGAARVATSTRHASSPPHAWTAAVFASTARSQARPAVLHRWCPPDQLRPV